MNPFLDFPGDRGMRAAVKNVADILEAVGRQHDDVSLSITFAFALFPRRQSDTTLASENSYFQIFQI